MRSLVCIGTISLLLIALGNTGLAAPLFGSKSQDHDFRKATASADKFRLRSDGTFEVGGSYDIKVSWDLSVGYEGEFYVDLFYLGSVKHRGVGRQPLNIPRIVFPAEDLTGVLGAEVGIAPWRQMEGLDLELYLKLGVVNPGSSPRFPIEITLGARWHDIRVEVEGFLGTHRIGFDAVYYFDMESSASLRKKTEDRLEEIRIGVMMRWHVTFNESYRFKHPDIGTLQPYDRMAVLFGGGARMAFARYFALYLLIHLFWEGGDLNQIRVVDSFQLSIGLGVRVRY